MKVVRAVLLAVLLVLFFFVFMFGSFMAGRKCEEDMWIKELVKRDKGLGEFNKYLWSLEHQVQPYEGKGYKGVEITIYRGGLMFVQGINKDDTKQQELWGGRREKDAKEKTEQPLQ